MTANQSQTHPEAPARTPPRADAGRLSSVSTTRSDPRGTVEEPTHQPSADDVLALLGDEYVADIVEALSDRPMPARALADTCDMSRATVYRRLERLCEAGLVTSHTAIERDGHHRQEFRLVLDELQIQVDEDGFDCTVRIGDQTHG